METQIKRWGDSSVLLLNKEFMKFMGLKVGDWVNIDDIVKIKPKGDLKK